MSQSWWGKKFLEALVKIIDEARLARGKAYRTDERIVKYSIEEGIVKATVRGNVNPYYGIYKAPKYEVTITFEPIKDWNGIIKKIHGSPDVLARLILQELPENIEKIASFLPKSSKDFTTSCTCPDYCNPCKHIAGVFYRLAQDLDFDPLLLFCIRGLSLERLKSQFAILTPEIGPAQIDAHFYEKVDNAPLDDISLKKFWGHAYKNCDENVSSIPALLIKKVGPYPAFWVNQKPFLEVMTDIYKHAKRNFIKK